MGPVVALVTCGAAWVEPHARALECAGWDVRRAAATRDLLVALDALPHAVLLVADAGEGLCPAAVLATLRAHDATRAVPALVLCPPGDRDVPATLVGAAAAPFVSGDAPPEALVQAVTVAAEGALRTALAEERASALEAELRSLRERQAALRGAVDAVTHDLRTLLGVAVGCAANLRDEVPGPPGATPQDQAARVVEAGLAASELVERFRAETRALLQAPAPASRATGRGRRALVDLGGLAARVVALFADEARQRGVALACEVDGLVEVWGERERLTQVVLNLVANALKFTPAGGRVRCAVRLAPAPEGTGAAQRRQAELVVSDTGPGIPEGERARVFERGYRLARDGAAPGEGVGLAVSREVVVRHRGHVRVDDGPWGGGTSVVVVLPVDARERAAPGVLVVREGGAADALVEALLVGGPNPPRALDPAGGEAFLQAARACRAVVMLARDGRAEALASAVGGEQGEP